MCAIVKPGSKMLDFDKINADLITSNSCRLCLKNIGIISIFERKENGNSLAEMLIFTTSLTVSILIALIFHFSLLKLILLRISHEIMVILSVFAVPVLKE